ncbi:MAG: type II toxin-antitoxin system HicB family antitoxin [Bacteroidetes bacterium]|nr:type II toxin-antitoxin system HicB family antitoxin [Bacteroidota bacterium]
MKIEKTRHLPILIEQDEDDFYIVSCPLLKGCHSYGKTIDEAMQNIQEVIELCLEDEDDNNTVNKFIGFRDIEFKIAS